MDRRTFLQTTGLGGLGGLAGCGSFLGGTGPAPEAPAGRCTQAAGGPENRSTAPAPAVDGRVWSRSLPERHVTPPVVAQDTVVVGTAGGELLAVALATGDERWRRSVSGVQGAPAVVDDWVVVAADDGRLHRFGLSAGTASDPIELGSSMRSSVTGADGNAFVIATPGTLVAVDVPSWDVNWSVDLETRGVGKPAVGNGRVVVSGTRPDGQGRLRVLDAADGTESWRVETAKGLGQTPALGRASIVVAGDHGNQLRASPGDGYPDPAGVFWFDHEGAVQRAETLEPPIWRHCTVRFLGASSTWTTVTGCNGLVAHGEDDTVWSTTLPQGIVTRPFLTPSGVLVGDAHGQFWLVHRDERRRLFAVEELPGTPAVLESGLVLPAGRRLVAFG